MQCNSQSLGRKENSTKMFFSFLTNLILFRKTPDCPSSQGGYKLWLLETGTLQSK